MNPFAEALQASVPHVPEPEPSAVEYTPEPGTITVDRQFSDLSNAQLFAAQHHGRIRYVYGQELWLIWDGVCWRRDDTGGVVRLAKATAKSLLHQDYIGTWKEQDAALKFAVKSQNRRQLMDFIALARSEPGIATATGELDADPWLFNCANGTLDLRTGRLRPHDRRDLLTKAIQVAFDAQATCPRWMAFLERATGGDQELMVFLQRAIGYALTGSTQEQKLFYLFGLGRNGKTAFMETVLSLLVGYARRIPSESLMVRQHGGGIPNDLAMLAAARVACASETAEGAQLDEAKIKEITGGDTITARFLHKEFFEYQPQFKLWIVGNHKPIIKGSDLGIWRRILLIPFTVTVPEAEVDPALPAKLREELPGILAWAVRGCLDWQRHGLGTPRAVAAATQDYQRESDLIGQFLDERCRLTQGTESPVPAIYGSYRLWAESGGLRPVTAVSFGRKLSERGFSMRRANGQTRVAGLLLAG
ncbi:MAG: hypothetical protein HQM04_13295 [Magnetococcales bacterium]|nr:hypothetical protein [Magnetococcales bacterium]MBF0116000.1 hypothetical protein [Magnetococcales bacterium]